MVQHWMRAIEVYHKVPVCNAVAFTFTSVLEVSQVPQVPQVPQIPQVPQVSSYPFNMEACGQVPPTTTADR